MPETQLLGRIAVHNKLITMDQLAEATRQQADRQDETNLGDILLELGFIDRRQLEALIKAQRATIARAKAKGATLRIAPGLEATPTLDEPAVRTPEPAAPPEPVAPPPVASQPTEVVETAPPAKSRPLRQQPKETGVESDSGSVDAGSADWLTELDSLPKTTAEDRKRFDGLLAQLVSQGASDIHIHGGSDIKIRIAGRLSSAGAPIAASDTEALVLSALNDEQRSVFAERGEVDMCYSLEGVGRFRTNVYRQQRGVDGVFRFIPEQPPSLESLGLPGLLAKFTNYHQGMVLCTGPTGCGKSSTLAAMIDLINEERREHILTIEDPIEYLHPSKRSLVNQRSVRHHTESFARALRAALREDPDVIVIGELRDLETIALALSAAETGHLVLATLHTNNAIRTLNRLIGAFPADQQGQIRTMMSESLRAVISQRLIPRADGQGRVPAIEKLVITKAVGNLIRENKTFQIQSIMQTGTSQGMGLLDDSIKQLLRDGVITQQEAERFCEDPKNLR